MKHIAQFLLITLAAFLVASCASAVSWHGWQADRLADECGGMGGQQPVDCAQQGRDK
jgi:hypothetical protein